VTEVGMSPSEAVQAAGLVPLRALGLRAEQTAGSAADSLLAPGMPADLLLLDRDMSIRRTWYSHCRRGATTGPLRMRWPAMARLGYGCPAPHRHRRRQLPQ